MSLRKEMLVAISLGLLLGGVAALFLAEIPQKFFSKQPQRSEAEISASPSPFFEKTLTLEVVFPQNQALSEEEEIVISGKTAPDALVIATSQSSENVTRADKEGSFSLPITLTEGANEILIAALTGDQSEEKVIIVNYRQKE